MNTRSAFAIIAMFLSSNAIAWEEEKVVEFITHTNQMLMSHLMVMDAYKKPDTFNWIVQNTSLVARLGAGGTDFSQAPYTAYAGIQLNVPLSSISIDRQNSLQRVQEAKDVTELDRQLMEDITLLRSMETDIDAANIRKEFLKQKAAWQKKRVEEGYSAELDQLWVIGQALNTEDALIAKTEKQAKTQKFKIARYAGDSWKTLLNYLNCKDNIRCNL
jgi:hypothetical protein